MGKKMEKGKYYDKGKILFEEEYINGETIEKLYFF